MDAEKLNWLIDTQPNDVIFVARYVEGLFTPFRFRVSGLLSQVEVSPPEFTAESGITVAASTTVQLTATVNVISSVSTGSVIALPDSITSSMVTVINRTGTNVTVSTLSGVTIENQASVTLPVDTSTTFYYVGGDQWYAQ